MYWLEVSVVTDGEGAEAVAEALRPFAYNDGVALEQLGDMDNLDPDALEPEVTVKIYIPEDGDTPEKRHRIEETIYHLGRLYPLPEPIFRPLQEQDWANAWKENYHPFRVGKKIWIEPSWFEGISEAAADDVVLTLDPGMAFGTGTHPTTQMCMQALEQVIQPGMSVLDVGTGSGILAILAKKLGAEQMVGVDTDELAVKTAVANAHQNNTQITFQMGTLTSIQQKGWDVVVVNILAPIIIGMLLQDELMRYVRQDGRLILSGIIDQQMVDVETAVRQAGGEISQILTVRDWVCFIIKQKTPTN
jgi:ribosomal protein L11 methyltransferase